MISIMRWNAIATTMISIIFVFTIVFFSTNQGIAQEDLQGLESSLPSPTTGPGMSINTSSDIAGSIQNKVTVGSFGDAF
jgi:hypothetical protein